MSCGHAGTEELAANRFRSCSSTPTVGLTFEFTREPELLAQYHQIYEKEFRRTHNAPGYVSIEDEQGAHDYLIVRRGDSCVGGARLSVKTPPKRHLLPDEMGDFRIERHFPELAHEQSRYGQVSRVCLLSELRGGDVTRRMYQCLYRKAVDLRLEVVFASASRPFARVHKLHCIEMGLKNVQIHCGIEVPEYPTCQGVKFYLLSGRIDGSLT